MPRRWGLGPVFAFEWLVTSRRWQVYAARSLCAGMVLASLSVVWLSRPDAVRQLVSHREQAKLGQALSMAIIGTQLVLVLLAAPAATAGSICLDKARGTLAHLLVTDLSDVEIVLGKLVGRLLPVVAVVACLLPVMALATLLGGIDPQNLTGAFLVTLGVAALGCSLALVLSVWGSKTHEVLLATYAILLIWVLAGPALWFLRMSGVWTWWGVPAWLNHISPFWVALGNSLWPGVVGVQEVAAFLAATLGISAVLAAIAVLRLRAVAARQAGRAPRRRAGAFSTVSSLPVKLPGPGLDPNPVLWREWHRRRPSRWGRVLWGAFAAVAVAATYLMLWCVIWGGRPQREISMVLNGGIVAVGFLLLSVSAATSLAEERVRGSLDVLLATPLPTPAIVWGKWWGAFRGTILLSVLPAIVTVAVSLRVGRPLAVLLEVGLILAFGAALTSLGLAVATRVPRLGRAIALTVTAYILVTVGWLFFAVMLTEGSPGADGPGLASASPFIGTIFPLIEMQETRTVQWHECVAWMTFWIVVYLLIAVGLMISTLVSFDRCLGRASGGPRFSPPAPKPKPRAEPVGALD